MESGKTPSFYDSSIAIRRLLIMISILPYGDTALLINFEQKIDRQIHAQVLALQSALAGVPGIRYMIPAYCSLTVAFDPENTTYKTLHEQIEWALAHTHMATPIAVAGLSDKQSGIHTYHATRNSHHVIPVCYDPGFSPDLHEVSAQTGKTIEEIIGTHVNTEFYVYMLGFMPGFAYMGDMPEEFSCGRKEKPRARVPAGSVGLALRQTAIYPFESPGGWQLIGRTPVRMFDPSLGTGSLLRAGDTVRFRRITSSEFSEYQ